MKPSNKKSLQVFISSAGNLSINFYLAIFTITGLLSGSTLYSLFGFALVTGYAWKHREIRIE
jgi:hypothetical protein